MNIAGQWICYNRIHLWGKKTDDLELEDYVRRLKEN